MVEKDRKGDIETVEKERKRQNSGKRPQPQCLKWWKRNATARPKMAEKERKRKVQNGGKGLQTVYFGMLYLHKLPVNSKVPRFKKKLLHGHTVNKGQETGSQGS